MEVPSKAISILWLIWKQNSCIPSQKQKFFAYCLPPQLKITIKPGVTQTWNTSSQKPWEWLRLREINLSEAATSLMLETHFQRAGMQFIQDVKENARRSDIWKRTHTPNISLKSPNEGMQHMCVFKTLLKMSSLLIGKPLLQTSIYLSLHIYVWGKYLHTCYN